MYRFLAFALSLIPFAVLAAVTQVDDGLECVQDGGSGNRITHGNPTGSPDLLIVTAAGYSGSNNDFEIKWGESDWSATQTLTRAAQATTSGMHVEIHYLVDPDTSYEKIEISSNSYGEGISVTYSFFAGTDATPLLEGWASAEYGSADDDNIFTGGSNGDAIYIGGHGYDSGGGMQIDVDYHSVTNLGQSEGENCHSGNADHDIEHAWKDWSSGSSVRYTGDYSYGAAMLIEQDSGGGPAGPSIELLRRRGR